MSDSTVPGSAALCFACREGRHSECECCPCGCNSAALRRQYEVAKRRNANLPDSMSLAPKTPEGRKASGHAKRP